MSPRKSTGDYPANWPEIAHQVKEQADWKCVRCGHIHDPENGYMLTVHHLDLNKENCEWWNIPAPLSKMPFAHSSQGRYGTALDVSSLRVV